MRNGWKLSVLASLAVLACGCGSSTRILVQAPPPTGVQSSSPQAAAQLGFPGTATKNTTRVAGSDPVADAAGVALAVYPSSGAGTHPQIVALAPTDSWQAALASAVFSAAPLKAAILLSGSSSLPEATSGALKALAPTGSGPAGGAQVIRIGDVPTVHGERAAEIPGHDPYALAAAIDRFQSALVARASSDVVIAPADNAAYAMPAAGWAAESGDPILFVSHSGVPSATQQALQAHQHPRIYVLGPTSVIPEKVSKQLAKYGTVKRISGVSPSASSVAFAIYRDPPCTKGQPCAHVPGSFGWALRSPGHGYVLLDQRRPLDAAAAAPLSDSGSFAVQLVLGSSSKLDPSILNFFLNYATPGYTQEGPTAAVYNHAWMIGNEQAVSIPVQAEVDTLLEAVPQR
jgi:ell wall binding domain 2 (CWB2)